jgi:hypothetical protein
MVPLKLTSPSPSFMIVLLPRYNKMVEVSE